MMSSIWLLCIRSYLSLCPTVYASHCCILTSADESADESETDGALYINHRRHWQQALSKCKLLDFLSLPAHGTLLGDCYAVLSFLFALWVMY